MVSRQAYGGEYWETTSFGPFEDREAADKFVADGTHGIFHGGYVYDARKGRP